MLEQWIWVPKKITWKKHKRNDFRNGFPHLLHKSKSSLAKIYGISKDENKVTSKHVQLSKGHILIADWMCLNVEQRKNI